MGPQLGERGAGCGEADFSAAPAPRIGVPSPFSTPRLRCHQLLRTLSPGRELCSAAVGQRTTESWREEEVLGIRREDPRPPDRFPAASSPLGCERRASAPGAARGAGPVVSGRAGPVTHAQPGKAGPRRCPLGAGGLVGGQGSSSQPSAWQETCPTSGGCCSRGWGSGEGTVRGAESWHLFLQLVRSFMPTFGPGSQALVVQGHLEKPTKRPF